MPHRSISTIKSPKWPDITLEIGYENSNPGCAEQLQTGPDGTFQVTQHLEPGAAAGYSFHLNFALINNGSEPVRTPLRILWAEKDYDFCHDYMYIGYDSGTTWRMLSTSCQDGVTELEVVVPQGRHFLCCSPKYDNNDFATLVSELDQHSVFEKIDVAVTPEGRPIFCLRCGQKDGMKVVVTNRAHPYETAGSYCLSAWLKQVSASDARSNSLLENLEFYIFPLINPDGVAAGNCCLSTSGINFGRELATASEKDSGARDLIAFILSLAPNFYLDMHNNTGPHLNYAFRTNNAGLLKRFTSVAPDISYYQKIWHNIIREYDAGYLFRACYDRYGTICMVTEFPWYTLLPEEMEKFGCQFFDTLFPLLLE